MITLYKFGPAFGLRETGPFVLKLMAYMRLCKIDFAEDVQGDPRKAPKGKIPYIKDGDEEIGDSTFVVKHLKSKFGDPLAEGFTAELLAAGHALKVMLEERTYWAGMIYPRWIKKDSHKLLADTFFDNIPSLIRGTIFGFVAKGVARNAQGQGITRHIEAEIYELGIDDIKAVEVFLGDKPFMLGDRPAEVDCTVYPFLYGMGADVFPTGIKDYINGSPALLAYIARMEKAVFGEET